MQHGDVVLSVRPYYGGGHGEAPTGWYAVVDMGGFTLQSIRFEVRWYKRAWCAKALASRRKNQLKVLFTSLGVSVREDGDGGF